MTKKYIVTLEIEASSINGQSIEDALEFADYTLTLASVEEQENISLYDAPSVLEVKEKAKK